MDVCGVHNIGVEVGKSQVNHDACRLSSYTPAPVLLSDPEGNTQKNRRFALEQIERPQSSGYSNLNPALRLHERLLG